MKPKILPKSEIDSFVKRLLEAHELIGPRMLKGKVAYGPIANASELVLALGSPVKGPKESLFPQSETLLRFEGYISSALPCPRGEELRPQVIFGVRPCDARAFAVLDRLFINEDYVDPYYKAKREATTIICLSCSKPKSTCFCTSVGGDPFGIEGCDVTMTRVGEDYLVEAVTDKGGRLVEDLKDADRSLLEEKERSKKKAVESMTSKVDIEGLPEKLKTMFEHPVWEEITEKCMGCGVCTYLCPTCHCFDIQDEAVDNKGERVRNWDSCMFPIFTFHGSGHQPRTKRHQRMRQRIMHKFNYYVENFGIVACVGCGRCITECPANEDLRDNLKKLKELKTG